MRAWRGETSQLVSCTGRLEPAPAAVDGGENVHSGMMESGNPAAIVLCVYSSVQIIVSAETAGDFGG